MLIIFEILCITHQIVIKKSWYTCLSVPWYDRLHREARVSDARRNEHMGYCSFLGAKSGAFKKTGYFRRKCPCWESNPVLLTIDRLFNHHSKSSLTICLLLLLWPLILHNYHCSPIQDKIYDLYNKVGYKGNGINMLEQLFKVHQYQVRGHYLGPCSHLYSHSNILYNILSE